ncbi:MAG: grasp-with-spasm system ATP-grasp peptide maturase [Bacteroidota bacterium]
MILIQSSNEDIATSAVIDWLNYYGCKYFRINENSLLYEINCVKNNISFCFTDVLGNKQKIDLSQVSAYWYRRGYSNIETPKHTQGNNVFLDAINEHFSHESATLENLTYYLFNHIHGQKIGHIRFNHINKIVVLSMARKAGLDVPDTAIISSKNALTAFYNQHSPSGIITKSLNQSFGLQDDVNSIYIAGYTSLFGNAEIDQCPETFFPTLFQEAIPKKFELRIFYLNGKFFSSAIFSQNDEKTKVDFRNYNFEKPNRTPPFKLPESIEKKITDLMQKMELNSGSIDMIYSETGKYIFLEVNPVGQFWQVSYPCNYYLEREIAKTLCG